MAGKWPTADDLMIDLLPRGGSVLDLSAGDGSLLMRAREAGASKVCAVEWGLANLSECVKKGLPVIRAELDDGLAAFPDDSFDTVVLSQTLQRLRRPTFLLWEMPRVARRCIVSVPNFGHWRARSFFALEGRLPLSPGAPRAWFATPSVHHITAKDFRDLITASGNVIEREIPIRFRDGAPEELRFMPDLRATDIVSILARQNGWSGPSGQSSLPG